MDSDRSGPLRPALKFSGAAAAAYLLAGWLALAFLEHADWWEKDDYFDLNYWAHAFSVILVFPFSLLLSLGFLRFTSLGLRRMQLWRAVIAGTGAGLLVWLAVISGAQDLASPFLLAFSGGHLVAWILPPWGSRRVP